jgi:SAM-dependent methyltransferase
MMDLSRRVFDRELMDEPDADPAELAGALRGLEFINGNLGGYRTSLTGLNQVVEAVGPLTVPWTVLDVGCGSGDTLEQFHKWAQRRSLPLISRGIELSGVTADLARKRLAAAKITGSRITVANLFDLDPVRDRTDIVHASLVLHHMESDKDTIRALEAMGRLARRAVIINDLHRHRFAYDSIRLLTGLFSRNAILKHDAALSVRRGFLRAELLELATQAGWDPYRITIRWHWAFRWLMVYRPESRRVHPADDGTRP